MIGKRGFPKHKSTDISDIRWGLREGKKALEVARKKGRIHREAENAGGKRAQL